MRRSVNRSTPWSFLGASLLLLASVSLRVSAHADEPKSPLPEELLRHPRGCIILQSYAEMLKNLIPKEPLAEHIEDPWLHSGNIWGWISHNPEDLSKLQKLKIELVGDPLEAKAMKLLVRDEKNKIVKSAEIPWDPQAHRREIYYRSMKLEHPTQLTSESLDQIPNPSVRRQMKINRDVLAFAEPRFAQEILEGQRSFTQKEWYSYEHAIDRHAILTGEKPLDSLYTMIGQGWSIDPSILKHTSEIHSLDSFSHNQVRALWIKTAASRPREENLDLALNSLILEMKHYKEEIGMAHLHRKPFAFSVHVDDETRPVNFHFLDLKALEENAPYGAEGQWLNAHKDLQNYIDGPYQNEIGMAPEVTEKLHQFTTENANRLQYFFLTEEPFSVGAPFVKKSAIASPLLPETETVFKQTGSIEHFKMKGSFGVIYSEDPLTQPLSMEKYAGIKLDRKPGEKVAELIRFSIDPNDRDFGPKFMWKMSSYLANAEGVSRVFAITDEAYAKKLIENFGFKKIQARPTNLGHDEWVIEVNPQEFFNRSVITPPKK